MRNYTKAEGHAVHAGTGNNMYVDNTIWSPDDGNAIVWAMVELAKAAGLPLKDFNPDDPTTYNWLKDAITQITQYQTPTQTVPYTGFNDMPVGSISPLMFSATGMSVKWTYANGAPVPITPELQDWFDSDLQGLISAFNSSIDTLNALPAQDQPANIPAKVEIIGSELITPDLMGFEAFFKGGAVGVLQHDVLKNHTIHLLSAGNFGVSTGAPHMALSYSLAKGLTATYNGSQADVSYVENSTSTSPANPYAKYFGATETRPKNISLPIFFKIA